MAAFEGSNGSSYPSVAQQAVRLLAAVALTFAAGCVRYVEPDDPPGTYVSEATGTELVLRSNGTYVLQRGADEASGRWSLWPGCAMGIDKIVLTPDGGGREVWVPAAERWFGGLELYMDDSKLRRR